MTRRFLATALAHWPKPQPNIYTTCLKTNIRDFYTLNQKIDGKNNKMIELMLGDYQRIKIYPQNGWMVKQPIYPEVDEAYERLIKDKIFVKPIN